MDQKIQCHLTNCFITWVIVTTILMVSNKKESDNLFNLFNQLLQIHFTLVVITLGADTYVHTYLGQKHS